MILSKFILKNMQDRKNPYVISKYMHTADIVDATVISVCMTLVE